VEERRDKAVPPYLGENYPRFIGTLLIAIHV